MARGELVTLLGPLCILITHLLRECLKAWDEPWPEVPEERSVYLLQSLLGAGIHTHVQLGDWEEGSGGVEIIHSCVAIGCFLASYLTLNKASLNDHNWTWFLKVYKELVSYNQKSIFDKNGKLSPVPNLTFELLEVLLVLIPNHTLGTRRSDSAHV